MWQGKTEQGAWFQQESHLPINVLELRVIRLALLHWSALFKARAVLVQCDNTTAVAYINSQGGTQSRGALTEAEEIVKWAERNKVLSRHKIVTGEWELHHKVFQDLVQIWGLPQINLVASRINRKIP